MSGRQRTLWLFAATLVLWPSVIWALEPGQEGVLIKREDVYKLREVRTEEGPIVPPPPVLPPNIKPTDAGGVFASSAQGELGPGGLRPVPGGGFLPPTGGGLGSPADRTRLALKRLIRRLG